MSGRLSISPLVALAIICVSCSSVLAGLCIPSKAEPESPYHFMVSFAGALSYAQSALDRVEGAETSTDPVATATNLLFGLRLAQGDFDCAIRSIGDYTSNSKEAIKTSATSAKLSFIVLKKLQGDYAAKYRELIDSGKEVKLGTYLDEVAKLGSASDDLWKDLILAAILGTYTVIEEDPDTHVSRLALPAQQRDEILLKLRSTFGDSVTKGLQQDRSR
jgi:hypothetical protein